MVFSILLGVFIVIYVLLLITPITERVESVEYVVEDNVIYLPPPRKLTNITVEEAILLRRSIREYTEDPIRLEHLSMILWGAYGITDPRGFRASPSAGATYPLELYVVIGEKGVVVENGVYLKPGVYRYDVNRHLLILIKEGDFRRELAEAALGQTWVREAPVNIVVFAVFERTTRIYGERGEVRYVPMEVGHLGQNIYLLTTALGYGTVVVGAFYDNSVHEIIGAGGEETPMYIIPIGKPRYIHHVTFEDIWIYIRDKRGSR